MITNEQFRNTLETFVDNTYLTSGYYGNVIECLIEAIVFDVDSQNQNFRNNINNLFTDATPSPNGLIRFDRK